MALEFLIDTYGEPMLLALIGLLVGLVFGAAAQHSRFCLRAATVEFSERSIGPRSAIWLIAFFTAMVATQSMVALGLLDVGETRQLAATGSISGAVLGGTIFGVGMVLARGCASRLLILSATGNLRAIVTGLVLTLVAQASLSGVLSPLRISFTQLWTIPGGTGRNLLDLFDVGHGPIAVISLICLLGSIGLGWRHRSGTTRIIAAVVVGCAIALGWIGTFAIASASFDVVPISSVTFTGPSTEILMGLVNFQSIPLTFSTGLVPGVFVGSFAAALATREFHIKRFEANAPMERYLIGAVLMGFGSMLAGGCAVGAGMSGGAILALTAWVTVFSMWIGAVITTLALSRFSVGLSGTGAAPSS